MPKPASHIRLPITPTILRCLKAQWAQEVNHALSCMLCGGYRFLRAGKFRVTSSDELDPSSCLSLEDIAVDKHDDPSLIRITLNTVRQIHFDTE